MLSSHATERLAASLLSRMRSPVESMKPLAPAPFPGRLAVLGAVLFFLYLRGSAWQPPLDRANHPFYLLWFSGVFFVYVMALLNIRRHALQPHPFVMPL